MINENNKTTHCEPCEKLEIFLTSNQNNKKEIPNENTLEHLHIHKPFQ